MYTHIARCCTGSVHVIEHNCCSRSAVVCDDVVPLSAGLQMPCRVYLHVVQPRYVDSTVDATREHAPYYVSPCRFLNVQCSPSQACRSALHEAAQKGNVAMIQQLLEETDDVTTIDMVGVLSIVVFPTLVAFAACICAWVCLPVTAINAFIHMFLTFIV